MEHLLALFSPPRGPFTRACCCGVVIIRLAIGLPTAITIDEQSAKPQYQQQPLFISAFGQQSRPARYSISFVHQSLAQIFLTHSNNVQSNVYAAVPGSGKLGGAKRVPYQESTDQPTPGRQRLGSASQRSGRQSRRFVWRWRGGDVHMSR